MTGKALINSKTEFNSIAKPFLDTMYCMALKHDFGDIEVRIFPKDRLPEQYFCEASEQAVNIAYDLCNSGVDVYFGVNPRVGKRGKKENVHYVTAFHVEVDYGSDGHKKHSEYETYDDALNAINDFQLRPTLINHSGGGFHCYWVLKDPVKVESAGVKALESINKSLSEKLGGDSGTQDISRVLRIPGTYNFKLENNPREVTVISSDGPTYEYKEFEQFIKTKENTQKERKEKAPSSTSITSQHGNWDQSIDSLPVSGRIKALIQHGKDGTYKSRSEADQAVITALVNKGVSEADIKSIFESYSIGEKYREHSAADKYLQHNIEKAKEMSNLSDEEMHDPLFISGALRKDDKKYYLQVVKFQEYMVKKYRLKYLEKENAFFKYNSKCYEHCTEESLNHMCQGELSEFRDLFAKSKLKDFIHFCIGDELVDCEKAKEDQITYLTLQNGLYNLNEETLNTHTPDIFTTNLLPYEFDPDAQCPRFLKYLDEVFLSDSEKIKFIQEAIGYAFLKEIPKPAIFFMIGDGSNGKSVFIDTITSLFGEENVCSISLNALSNEYYILGLFGKMINISSETPHKKQTNTDMVKAVVAGDWVTGRVPYKQPTKFKPYAKHYLAMNKIPSIDDNSHGMWRRLYIIEFPKTFSEEEMDVHLTQKLRNELSGIFNWALEGYKRLRKRKFIFSEVLSMKTSKQNYKDQSNSVFSFASQHLKKAGLDDRVKFSRAYDLYKSFCEMEGYDSPHKKKDFKEILKEAGFTIEKSSKDNNQVHIFGARLIENIE